MKSLAAELREIDTAQQALAGYAKPTDSFEGKRRRSGSLTLKDRVIEVLSEKGATDSGGILKAIKEKYGMDMPRTSLSPQLTRLKADGHILYDLTNGTWLINNNSMAKPVEEFSDLAIENEHGLA